MTLSFESAKVPHVRANYGVLVNGGLTRDYWFWAKTCSMEFPRREARSGAVLSRRSMASADHLNLKFSRLSLLIDRQPISFMSRSISLWRF
jgi:hypothetical protein